ncbi:hypothetical protein SAMN06297387_113170 [Streptomyces zhaozhouensis]|uniref:Uncharacterized protein n=1 Tax=Streptomyces zhaozhouensis TaxID=1300267 RepID=A0A286DZD0_9ACTN|nr:hypothetical protein [Streptomyces zhaozhouensis]SOD64011.1 hypothetical protein SAMN06297387_113170 [Streptomyces zhaozhouensis]
MTLSSDGTDGGAGRCQRALLHWEKQRGLAMPTVIHMTRTEALRQREELLERAGLSYEQLRERADAYALTMEQLLIWHTIEGLDYLLSDE